MIRINLLDDIKVAHSHSGVGGIKPISIDGKQVVNFIVKIGFVLLPSLAILGWNYTEKTAKEKVLNVLKVREQEVVSKIEQEQQKYNEIKKLQQETLKLDRTIETLSEAARKRTTTLKALNLLHQIVPDQTWLTEVELQKGNKIIFTGEAKPSDINIFKTNLNEKKAIYRDVNISPNEDLKNTKTDYTKFKISAELVLDQDREESLNNIENNTIQVDEAAAAAQTEDAINQDREESLNNIENNTTQVDEAAAAAQTEDAINQDREESLNNIENNTTQVDEAAAAQTEDAINQDKGTLTDKKQSL